jgi:hypothetical protein
VPDLKRLEEIAAELINTFDINTPPVPIESMLQHPKPDMWEEVDISKLSGGFLNIREYYSPRMSLARLLARHVIISQWGKERGLSEIMRDEDMIYAFARMLIMPASMVNSLSSGARTPSAMSVHFEVPEEDARIRLQELAR